MALVAWAFVRASTYDVASLERRAPERTALMRQREAEARRHGRTASVSRRWVPFERISPLLRRAVLVAEDDRFFSHQGLDWTEIQASARANAERGGIARGGSTITQQLAKNVFTGAQRTPMRKLTELFTAFRMEKALGKRRILELYLNAIEWGPGVYGAEAAARHWYGTSASSLTPTQAVRLAAVIINPRRYSPLEPNRRIERRVRMIAQRMRRRGWLDDTQWATVTGQPPPADSLAADSAAAPDSAADFPAPMPDPEPLPDEIPAPQDSLSLPAPP